jgi:hypothetical protein
VETDPGGIDATVTDTHDLRYGPKTERVLAVLRQARELKPDEVAALDSAEASVHRQIERAWDDLRAAIRTEPWRGWCLAAGNDAWDALAVAAARAGISVPSARTASEDAFWHVVSRPGLGAARAARLIAIGLAAPPGVDRSLVAMVRHPWDSVAGDPDDPHRNDSSLTRSRRGLLDDFMTERGVDEPFDNSWFPRGYGTSTAIAPGMPCDFGPGGVAWHCFESHGHPFELTYPLEGARERLEADLAETSAQVSCDGPASIRADFTYPAVDLAVCKNHEQWLRRHRLLNGRRRIVTAPFSDCVGAYRFDWPPQDGWPGWDPPFVGGQCPAVAGEAHQEMRAIAAEAFGEDWPANRSEAVVWLALHVSPCRPDQFNAFSAGPLWALQADRPAEPSDPTDETLSAGTRVGYLGQTSDPAEGYLALLFAVKDGAQAGRRLIVEPPDYGRGTTGGLAANVAIAPIDRSPHEDRNASDRLEARLRHAVLAPLLRRITTFDVFGE